jgi:hypothetical protein
MAKKQVEILADMAGTLELLVTKLDGILTVLSEKSPPDHSVTRMEVIAEHVSDTLSAIKERLYKPWE